MNTWGSVGRASCHSAQKDGLEKGGRALTEWPRPMKWEGGSLPDLSDFFWYASLPCILAWLQTGDIMPSWCRMFSGIQRPALGNCITSHFLHQCAAQMGLIVPTPALPFSCPSLQLGWASSWNYLPTTRGLFSYSPSTHSSAAVQGRFAIHPIFLFLNLL